jgi:proteic killer suppression protein
MIHSFRQRDAERLFSDVSVRRWRSMERVARRKLMLLHAATRLEDLAVPPGNRPETLRGSRSGQHSIRVNDQWRVCFQWRDGDAYDVEIADCH